MLSSIEIIDTQNTIIKMQSEIIYDLFGLLKQYVSVEELDNIPAMKKINDVARMNEEIEC
jgi:hypothetical protein